MNGGTCITGFMENAMLITHEREKIINAIIFFAKNVKHLGKIKLFKLLYFLDFEHFKETGRSVTGLDYYAWKMGPAPAALFDEIEAPEPDMQKSIRFTNVMTEHGTKMLTIKARVAFNKSHFTAREMRLMERLAGEYKDTLAEGMIEKTHLENLPWYKVYMIEKNPRGKIPYEYSLPEHEEEAMLKIISERNEFIDALRNTNA